MYTWGIPKYILPPNTKAKSPDTKAIPYGKIGAILWFYGYVLFVILYFPSAPTCRSCALPYTSLVSHILYGALGGGIILCGCLFSKIIGVVNACFSTKKKYKLYY